MKFMKTWYIKVPLTKKRLEAAFIGGCREVTAQKNRLAHNKKH